MNPSTRRQRDDLIALVVRLCRGRSDDEAKQAREYLASLKSPHGSLLTFRDLVADGVLAHSHRPRTRTYFGQFPDDPYYQTAEEEAENSPYCECDNEPDEEELASNTCKACGKAVT